MADQMTRRARINPLHPTSDPVPELPVVPIEELGEAFARGERHLRVRMTRSETVPDAGSLVPADGVDGRGPSGILPGTGGLTVSELPSRRFVLHPAWIVSRRDGQRHFVAVGELAALYGLRLDDPDVVVGAFASRRGDRSRPGDVDLWPRFDGEYRSVR